jgi:arylsulfatase A-like enzyme
MPDRKDLHGMNVVLLITDQQRAIQHFPPDWAEKNLHALTRLKRHGLTFERAFCNSCMCSPSRATLVTGYFPAQHGVKWTLETDMPDDQYPQKSLPTDLANLATVMASAGYSTPWKGKFHITKPASKTGTYTAEDIAKYGFERWNPPDGGANQDPSEFGGGYMDHDKRYVDYDGPVEFGQEGILAYLRSPAAREKPFFLTVSLVNPHDVLAYPNTAFWNGYTPAWLEGDIELPATVNEDLSTKPTVQGQFLKLTNLGLGNLTPVQQRNYLNFYGNLMISSDRHLTRVLDALEEHGMLENSLIIQTADHGEMGMTHGGQRQKNFNFYEESLRVPLVYSNPKLFPEPVVSRAMVSHVDFLPTLASLFDAPKKARADWQGVDYSRVVLHPEAQATQDYIVFTYDDYQSGQASGPYPQPPNHIVSIREERYKLAKYYDDAEPPTVPDQWEMYDLATDPLETRNLANDIHCRTEHEEAEFVRLRAKLEVVERERLQALPQRGAGCTA